MERYLNSESAFRIDTGTAGIFIEGVPIERLVQRAGGTPCFIYGRSIISQRIRNLKLGLANKIGVHYAIKANPFPPLVFHVGTEVDGFDVASANEMRLAVDVLGDPEKVSFAGPGKDENSLRQACAAGVLIHIESLREARILAKISNETGWAARVALRINPLFGLKSSGMKMGGGAKQFGVDEEQAPNVLKELDSMQLAFEGFHIFSGSQSLKSENIIESQCESWKIVQKLSEFVRLPLKKVNLGGGFGIPYFTGETELNLDPILENLQNIADDAARLIPGVRLNIELGRYLVGESGIYVVRVIDRKVSRGKTFLVVNGGLNHHLVASGNFGQIVRKNYPVSALKSTEELIEATVVGPLCTPLDVLAEKIYLPANIGPGDFIVVFQSGAYGKTASPSAFLGHPEALEILV